MAEYDLERLGKLVSGAITEVVQDIESLKTYIQNDWDYNTTWWGVQSSNIHAIKYEKEKKELRIQFYVSPYVSEGQKKRKEGDSATYKPKKDMNKKNLGLITQYVYYDVPPDIPTKFRLAEIQNRSVGRAFFTLLKIYCIDNNPAVNERNKEKYKVDPFIKYKKEEIPTTYVPEKFWYPDRVSKLYLPQKVNVEELYINPVDGTSYIPPSVVPVLKEATEIVEEEMRQAKKEKRKQKKFYVTWLLMEAVKKLFRIKKK